MANIKCPDASWCLIHIRDPPKSCGRLAATTEIFYTLSLCCYPLVSSGDSGSKQDEEGLENCPYAANEQASPCVQVLESTCASYSCVALPRYQGPASGIRSHHCPHLGPSASFSPRPHSSLGCPPAHTDLLAPGLASPSFSFVADGGPVPSEAVCSHAARGASDSASRSPLEEIFRGTFRETQSGPAYQTQSCRTEDWPLPDPLPATGRDQVLLEIRALETWGRRHPLPRLLQHSLHPALGSW